MATIKERAASIYNLDVCKDETSKAQACAYIRGAQEERERCIKVITEMLDDPYEYYSVDGYTHNEYVDEDKIREAIENENE